MSDFNLFYLNEDFYKWLHTENLLNQFFKKDKRPYIGPIKIKNSLQDVFFIIPLSSDKNNSYRSDDENKKYDIPIFYTKINSKTGTKEQMQSVLKIGKMIPINNSFAFAIKNKKILSYEKEELDYLNDPEIQNQILKLANEVYNAKISVNYYEYLKNNDKKLLHSIDFVYAEWLKNEYQYEILSKSKIEKLINLCKEIKLPESEWNKTYFKTTTNWLNHLKQNSKVIFDVAKKYQEKSPEQIKKIINNFRKELNNLKFYDESKDRYLAHFWFEQNQIINQNLNKNLIFQSKNSMNNEFEVIDSKQNKTFFFHENEDILVWFGKNNKNQDKTFLLNKKTQKIYSKNTNNVLDFKKFVCKTISSHTKDFSSLIKKNYDPNEKSRIFEADLVNLRRHLTIMMKEKNKDFDLISLIKEKINQKVLIIDQLRNQKKNNIEKNEHNSYFLADEVPIYNKQKESGFLNSNPQKSKISNILWNQKRNQTIHIILEDIEKQRIQLEDLWRQKEPINFESKQTYNNFNNLILAHASIKNGWSDPRFLTLKQIQKNKLQIKPNAQVIKLEKLIFKQEQTIQDPETGQLKKIKVELEKPIVKYFDVYNASDCIGIKPYLHKIKSENDPQKINLFYNLIKKSTDVPVIENDLVDKTYYNKKADLVFISKKDCSTNSKEKLDILLNEISHSTAHLKRLNHFDEFNDSNNYDAKEKITNQISSFLVQKKLKLPVISAKKYKDLNYIESWIKPLKENPQIFLQAISEAQERSFYIENQYEEFNQNLKQKKIDQLNAKKSQQIKNSNF